MSLLMKLAPAALLSALLMTPASAAPVAPQAIDTASSIIQVQYGRHHDGRNHRSNRHNNMHRGPHRHGHWVPGHRYRSAPPGWRRYGARPGDWQRRGCIMAGPVWFCP